MNEGVKKIIAKSLCSLGGDAALRTINKHKVLVLTYHGVYRRSQAPIPLFTHLSDDLFRWQLQFLKDHYHILSMTEFVARLKAGADFPERSALITFDDGFRNNYDVAFPVLKELGVPATIFLTVDFIGKLKMLWFDKLFLLLKRYLLTGTSLGQIHHQLVEQKEVTNLHDLYEVATALYKTMSDAEKNERLDALTAESDLSEDPLAAQFMLMSWENVTEMFKSGLVDFGVHTATHRILRGLVAEEYSREIDVPRKTLSKRLGREVSTFSYPNGIPDRDFFTEHEDYLKRCGYSCAFSTRVALNDMTTGGRYRLNRIAIGNDLTSDRHLFPLRIAGLAAAGRKEC